MHFFAMKYPGVVECSQPKTSCSMHGATPNQLHAAGRCKLLPWGPRGGGVVRTGDGILPPSVGVGLAGQGAMMGVAVAVAAKWQLS